MRRRLSVGLAVLIALVAAVSALSAVKQRDQANGSNVAVTGSAVAQGGAGEPGSTIAFFRAKDVDGRAVKVGAGKPGALFFFAGWCGSCLVEAEALGAVQRQLGSRVAITAISPDPSDSREAIRRFRDNAGQVRYPFVWDSDGTLSRQYAVRALDTTVVYDKTGKVVFRDAAVSDVPTLMAAFRKAGVR